MEVTIALGGNAIARREDEGKVAGQLEQMRATAKELVHLIDEGDRILVTHGNGPQVGDILVQNEAAKELVPQMPLDICGAESQGMIGYMLQQALRNQLDAEGSQIPVVTVLTQVLVDKEDPAFLRPTKPIGPFYTKDESSRLTKEKGWVLVDDAGRGYRRVVPSPMPKAIIEKETISRLFDAGALVIAAGGGGVPVVRGDRGALKGTEAVLDKDRTAALLASTLKTRVLLILTDVDGVYLDFAKPTRRKVDRLDLESCKQYLDEGQFPPGSMGPKIESAISFLAAGGERVVIASLDEAEEALAGRAGTTITAERVA